VIAGGGMPGQSLFAHANNGDAGIAASTRAGEPSETVERTSATARDQRTMRRF